MDYTDGLNNIIIGTKYFHHSAINRSVAGFFTPKIAWFEVN